MTAVYSNKICLENSLGTGQHVISNIRLPGSLTYLNAAVLGKTWFWFAGRQNGQLSC